jgi:cytochrome c553
MDARKAITNVGFRDHAQQAGGRTARVQPLPRSDGAHRAMLNDVPVHRLVVPCFAFVLFDCARPAEPSHDPTAVERTSESASPENEAKQAPVSALEKARRSVTAHMPEHFGRAADLEQAIIRGDFDTARAAAAELAQHRPDRYPEPWAPFVLGMRVRAEDAARAGDLETLALATGEMMGSCGACHQALGARVAAPVEPEPPIHDGDITTLMKRHRWAATRLRAGVVEPSAYAWTEGVEAFAPLPAPTCGEDLGGERVIDVETLRDRFHAVQEEARVVDSLEARASVYGRLLGTCAGCHTGC